MDIVVADIAPRPPRCQIKTLPDGDGDSMRASEPLTALRGGQMRLEEPGTAVLGRLLPLGDSYATVSAAS